MLARPPNAPVTQLTQILIIKQQSSAAAFETILYGQGYQVDAVYWKQFRGGKPDEHQPDLIILDGLQPHSSSLDICRDLRQTMSQIPIILLAHASELYDALLGFEAGADDCMIAPFTVEELLVRIRVRLRYAQREKLPILHAQNLALDCQKRKVFWGYREIELTDKEFDLLKYLMLHAQQAISRDELMEQLWGINCELNSNIIDVYICRLRYKLESYSQARLIQTIYGVGYMLRDTGFMLENHQVYSAA